MSTLNVKFVAADREVWEGEASRLIARTTEGEIGILPGHQPILSVLVEGDVVTWLLHSEGDYVISEGP